MNQRKSPSRPGITLSLALLLLGLFGYRLWLLTQPWVGLYHDEAYYYHWSLIPDFGYYSKPPMIAWIIGLSSTLAGASAFGIKLGPALCWFASALVIAKTASELWGRASGLLAGLVFFTTPLAGFYSLFATTDAALLLFWSLALWAFLRAQAAIANQRDPLGWWLLAGLATGLGLLSKYTMFALPCSFLVFLLATPDRRRQFTSLGPWLAGIVALSLFGLNVLWNVQHDFVAWQHTSEIAKLDEGPPINPLSLLEFWLAQMAIFGVIGSVALMRWWRELAGTLRQSPALQIAVLGSAVLLLGISAQALLSRAFANWAAPIVIGLTFLLTALAQRHPRAVRLSVVFNLALLTGFYHWPQLLDASGANVNKRINPWYRVEPWADRLLASQQIDPQLLALPVASDSRAVLANLSFALHPKTFPGRYWDDQKGHIADYYDQTINFDSLDGQGAWLFAADHPITEQQRASFAKVSPVATIAEYYSWRPGDSLHLYRVENFLGYD